LSITAESAKSSVVRCGFNDGSSIVTLLARLLARLPFGFKIRRSVRHIEKYDNPPARLAMKRAAILFHRFDADGLGERVKPPDDFNPAKRLKKHK
jgi:hypothetical protein